MRFVFNTFVPCALTLAPMPTFSEDDRVVILSSAAQAPINVDALSVMAQLERIEAYAHIKLATTICPRELAKDLPNGPIVKAVNPGLMLAFKMVKEVYGWQVITRDMAMGSG